MLIEIGSGYVECECVAALLPDNLGSVNVILCSGATFQVVLTHGTTLADLAAAFNEANSGDPEPEPPLPGDEWKTA